MSLPILSLAQNVGTVKQVSVAQSKMAVSLTDQSINNGDFLIVTFKNDQQCSGEVIKIKDKIAMVDLSDCEKLSELKKGQTVEKSLFGNQTKQSTHNNRASETRAEISPFIRDSHLPTINESWYTMWGLGGNKINYNDSSTQKDADYLTDVASRSSYNFDFFGFYWPMSDHKTMMGFIVNAATDAWSTSTLKTSQRLTVTHIIYGFSTHHFFGANIGDGWFIRGDIGPSISSTSYTNSISDETYSTRTGIGLLGGGGYGWAIGQETRMLLGGNLAHRSVKKFSTTVLNVNLNFLF